MDEHPKALEIVIHEYDGATYKAHVVFGRLVLDRHYASLFAWIHENQIEAITGDTAIHFKCEDDAYLCYLAFA